ncbi:MULTISPECIES: FRG domain-containing protein [unclassified Bradyrhizobium]|uniref:FRG domain-containing protein n=1 Tax=unclassified Bradyrhizobium TaxID=2631580 RepID=UPI001FF99EF1|nr:MULTISPECIES: FRG domain-containing protein [unclassified Bradyrhizobium]
MKRPEPFRRNPDDPPRSSAATSKEDLTARAVRSQQKWHEFLSFLDRHMPSRYVFRGQSSVDWQLMPAAGRGGETYDPLFEERVFRAFKKDARLHMHLPETTDWDWLALGQHFGLPTRLLDWSTNPLVACYFALLDETAKTPGTGKLADAVVYAYPLDEKQIVDPSTWPSPFEIEEVGFLFPSSLAPRISSQRGLFSVHPKPNQPWQPDHLSAHRFIIPADYRFIFQRKLFRMGIDAAHIWANLEGVCASLKWQYEKKLGISAAGL